MGHEPDADTVDHFDKNPLNNRRYNLRVATKTTQCLNQKMHYDNTSGVKGVSFRAGRGAWQVTWADDNHRQKCKSFSTSKYGEDEAFRMAVDYRRYIEQTLPHYRVALTAP